MKPRVVGLYAIILLAVVMAILLLLGCQPSSTMQGHAGNQAKKKALWVVTGPMFGDATKKAKWSS